MLCCLFECGWHYQRWMGCRHFLQWCDTSDFDAIRISVLVGWRIYCLDVRTEYVESLQKMLGKLMNIKLLTFALALMAAGSASAATYTFGDVTDTSVSPKDALETDSGYFYVAPGSFTDWLTFSVTQPVLGTGQITEFQMNGLGITGMSVTLYMAGPSVSPFPVVFPDLNPFGPSVFSGSGLLPVAGNYYFEVSGIAGAQGGSYTFSAATMPVPEAETWTMMGLGLGLVALQLRRQGKKRAERLIA